MSATKPTSDQIRFLSALTGEHSLDTYIEESEKGGRTVGDLLDDIFLEDGTLDLDLEIRHQDNKLQYRFGGIDSFTSWRDIVTFFNSEQFTGFNKDYSPFQIVTILGTQCTPISNFNGVGIFLKDVANGDTQVIDPETGTPNTFQWLISPAQLSGLLQPKLDDAQSIIDQGLIDLNAIKTDAQTYSNNAEQHSIDAATHSASSSNSATASELSKTQTDANLLATQQAKDLADTSAANALTSETNALNSANNSEQSYQSSQASRLASETAQSFSELARIASEAEAEAAAISRNEAEQFAATVTSQTIFLGVWDTSGSTTPVPTVNGFYRITGNAALVNNVMVSAGDELMFDLGSTTWFRIGRDILTPDDITGLDALLNAKSNNHTHPYLSELGGTLTSDGLQLKLKSVTNSVPTGIEFDDNTSSSQLGYLRGSHSDSSFSASAGFNFDFSSTEASTSLSIDNNKVWHQGNDGTGSGLDADLLDGYQLSSTRNAANTIPLRDASGYLNLGWINTTSGLTTTNPSEIYVNTNDGYIRKQVKSTFISNWGLLTTTAKAADSNLLDGLDSSAFLRSNASDTYTGYMTTGSTSSSCDSGIYGAYLSTKIHHIWSMGSGYRVSSSGADFGNLYGMAYKHTNNTTGGTMAGGHQVVFCSSGTPSAAIGFAGNFWTIGNCYAEDGYQFYDRSQYILSCATNWGLYWDTGTNSVEFHGAGTSKAEIDCDTGNIWTDGSLTCSSWSVTSDERLKTNLKRVSPKQASEVLKKVDEYFYDMPSKNLTNQIGLMAQSFLKANCPEVVTHNKERDEYQLDYRAIAVLHQAARKYDLMRISAIESRLAKANL